MGRPKSENPKQCKVTVTLTDTEYAALQKRTAEAKKNVGFEIPITQVARSLIVKGLNA